MKNVLVYTSPSCPFCVRAKALLQQRGVPFKEMLLGWDDDKAWDDLTKKSGMKTVPQIFADDQLIGGFTELTELDQKDSLASLK
jgi:glutaredoxin 3